MLEIEIPKDIRQYDAKLIGPFTTRQLIFFIGGVLVGVPVFQVVKKAATMDVAAVCTMLCMAPFLAFGWVKIYGMKLEDFIKTAFVSNVLSPKHRVYKTANTFSKYFEPDPVPQKKNKKKKKVKRIPKAKNPELQSYF